MPTKKKQPSARRTKARVGSVAGSGIQRTTASKPPRACWLWHSEDADWFWSYDTRHMDFSGLAYDHLTHWSRGYTDDNGDNYAPLRPPSPNVPDEPRD